MKYTVIRASELEPKAVAGSIIYAYIGCDYGCSSDDTRIFGREYDSFTLDPEGGPPFFTMPVEDVTRS